MFYKGVNYDPSFKPLSSNTIAPLSQGSQSGDSANSGATSPSQNINAGGSLSVLPNPIASNIAAYNPYEQGSLMGGAMQRRGIEGYGNMQRQYGGGSFQGQNYVPWALQDQSAGGYGGMANQVGDLFINPISEIQAGANYQFGGQNQIGNQIMQSQYYRNPATGEIVRTGDAQSFANPYSAQFDMNNISANYIQNQMNKGIGMGPDPFKRVIDAGESYYNDIMKNVGIGQFDTQNFNKAAALGDYNKIASGPSGTKPFLAWTAPRNAENQRLIDAGVYAGYAPPPPGQQPRQAPNYMGNYGGMYG